MKFNNTIELSKDDYDAVKNGEIWKYDAVTNEFLTLEDRDKYLKALDKILYDNDYTDYCDFMNGKFLYDVSHDDFDNVIFYRSDFNDGAEEETIYTSIAWMSDTRVILVVNQII